MSPRLLVEPVDRIRQALLARVKAVMTHVVLERFPRRLLRILFRRVLRESNHSYPRIALEPLLDFRVRQMRRRIEPQHDLASKLRSSRRRQTSTTDEANR